MAAHHSRRNDPPDPKCFQTGLQTSGTRQHNHALMLCTVEILQEPEQVYLSAAVRIR
jgi:hypothetical protein